MEVLYMICKDRKDIFHAWLVKDAIFEGKWEMPKLPSIQSVPSELVSFSAIFSRKEQNLNSWVHFFIDDYKFERLWKKPLAYLERLRKYEGVISPDFSLYRDMPLVMQAWNTYRNRAMGYWLSQNGIRVIPNVRWGDERTYEFCFDGLPKHSAVAVGTHGCVKNRKDRGYFTSGFLTMLERIHPTRIIVYGKNNDRIFPPLFTHAYGVKIVSFESDFSLSHRIVA
jgi:hypothetical protein